MTRQPLHRLWRRTALCAGALLLAGCMHTTRNATLRHYDLVAPATPPAHAKPTTPRHGQVLQITHIAAPAWLEGTAMYYRLDYEDGRTLAAYAQSDWIAPPADMLAAVIRNVLGASGDWYAVTGPDEPATAAVGLHIRLDDFSQAFSEPHDSAGVIDATATLIDNRHDRVLAQRHFRVEAAASGADAQAGVKALGEAADELAELLQRWLRAGDAQGFSQSRR